MSGVVPAHGIGADDEKDTKLLRHMLRDSEAYIRSFSWCKDVVSSFFDGTEDNRNGCSVAMNDTPDIEQPAVDEENGNASSVLSHFA